MYYIRTYKFRIYPDSKRRSEIDLQLVLSKNFYNKLLEAAKAEYEKDRSFKIKRSTFNVVKKKIIVENRDFLKIYSQTRCEIEDRVIKAYSNFFSRIKEKRSGKKIKAGFPRFKSIDKYYSIVYPQDNGAFSIEKGRLRVSRIGTMKIKLHRNIEGSMKTLTIKKAAGKFYAIFTTAKDECPIKVADTNPIGIDLGLNSFIALSNGRSITKPKFMKIRQKMAHWQRIVARKRKGSKSRERAKRKLQKEFEVATFQSNDFMHKLSAELVSSEFTSFAIEKLNIQNMMRNHRLAGSIQNASWNRFVQFLSYKAASAGMRLDIVDPRNTSQTCSNCGSIKFSKLQLKNRMYHCDACNYTEDRDINAAKNVLKRATAGRAESQASGDNVRLQQGAIVIERGTTRPKTEDGSPLL